MNNKAKQRTRFIHNKLNMVEGAAERRSYEASFYVYIVQNDKLLKRLIYLRIDKM